MEGVFCFVAPLALAYGFHARRHAPQRGLARAGLLLSLVVFVPCVLIMVAAVLNLLACFGR